MFTKGLFGLVIVKYIFATYLWVSSSPLHSFFPLSHIFYKMHSKLRPAWHWKLSLMNFIFCCRCQPDVIFSSLFVIRLQSFLFKDLWEKHILRTSGPGILQLSVMPLEAHRGSLFYIKCLKQGMLIESIWNCPVTDGGADIKLGRTSPNPVCMSFSFSFVRVLKASPQ